MITNETNALPIEHINLKTGLYVVPTPIGNLKDITLRALETLKSVEYIYCENTRHSRKLLSYYKIETPLRTYNDHSNEKDRTHIIQTAQNHPIALITDAGMPLISDPGYKLIQEIYTQKIFTTVLPGPCALVTAMALSSMPSDRFSFLGFFDTSKAAEFIDANTSLIFYESPKRLLKSLSWFSEHMKDRTISVCRELSKIHEENIIGRYEDVIEKFKNKPSIKGEFVLILSPPEKKSLNDDDILKLIQNNPQNLSAKDLIKLISTSYKLQKKRVYNLYHKNHA
ncbi:MAG: 16S rRNA (cytidine(1402)-2'-O)-methyltransferase [Alphaproteobacteria bacterium CG_4_10_14_0_8_um_filter_37_21]|nr:MAG: 16S rRNA (cytidine(1402)-2'-O)-methyltransferase [Alphaproteobacteria bacterium CG_4_10_14_0_8_um_filter_37_21]